ncbi:MAG: HEPN domain-containing protein [Thermacetogeniaceae bacterium]|nr:HEPN domain-containing protein [Syntrophomonadaceae bacterium]
MTGENIRENIRDEILKAANLLAAADLLAENGFINDAVSRLYYYLFYYIRALLLTESLQPKTHEGTFRLLGMHFVNNGLLNRSISLIFSKLMKYRQDADYNPSFFFTEADFKEFREEAVQAAFDIQEFLKKRGYIKLQKGNERERND